MNPDRFGGYYGNARLREQVSAIARKLAGRNFEDFEDWTQEAWAAIFTAGPSDESWAVTYAKRAARFQYRYRHRDQDHRSLLPLLEGRQSKSREPKPEMSSSAREHRHLRNGDLPLLPMDEREAFFQLTYLIAHHGLRALADRYERCRLESNDRGEVQVVVERDAPRSFEEALNRIESF